MFYQWECVILLLNSVLFMLRIYNGLKFTETYEHRAYLK